MGSVKPFRHHKEALSPSALEQGAEGMLGGGFQEEKGVLPKDGSSHLLGLIPSLFQFQEWAPEVKSEGVLKKP